MSRLVMIAPAPVIALGDGRVRLDVKFAEGMKLQSELWDGPLTCMLRATSGEIPFGATYQIDDLTFDLQIVNANQSFGVGWLNAGDVIAASGDMHDVLHLADPAARPGGTRIIYAIEYDHDTRLAILKLQPGVNPLRKLRSALWLYQQERRRKRAFRAADAIQANGYPAQAAYQRLTSDMLLYLDGRMTTDMMANAAQQNARAARLRDGAPLRLVHSGRLERMKGGHDLVPTAAALQQAGVDFTLDIFGTGALSDDIAAGVVAADLGDRVTLHGAVDFETALVPFISANADLFLSCHRQSDPSCTYIETMGCGVPVIGYANNMWQTMAAQSQGGWAVPLGDTGAIVAKIKDLNSDRVSLIAASKQALNFAKAHDFKSEFKLRMDHLATFAR